eukprot:38558_1
MFQRAYILTFWPEILREYNDIVISTWEEYSKQSHNNNKIHQQFHNLLGLNRISVITKKYEQCPHHQFKNHRSFLQLINGYINNELSFVQQVMRHDNSVEPMQTIKTGLCSYCICNLITQTNGLNNIHIQWQKKINKLILYRKELMNTNLIMFLQPLFLKSILMKSNIKCLQHIFRLFFIVYLKNSNLKELIMHNSHNVKDINQYGIWNVPQINPQSANDTFIISDQNINICHGFEHSLASLSTTIIRLLPLLKLYHIKYLFIDHKELNDIAEIINNFLRQYCNLPHIKCQDYIGCKLSETEQKQSDKWRKKINTDSIFRNYWPYKNDEGVAFWFGDNRDLTLKEVYEKFVLTKHPILQRFMFIISSLYQHFRHYRKKNSNCDAVLIKKLKLQCLRFKYFMDSGQTKMTHAKSLTKGNNYSKAIWNLVHVCMRYRMSNKEIKMEYYQCMNCCVCNIQRKELLGKKLKVCGGCKLVYYCSKTCQKYDWSRQNHRHICAPLKNSLLG